MWKVSHQITSAESLSLTLDWMILQHLVNENVRLHLNAIMCIYQVWVTGTNTTLGWALRKLQTTEQSSALTGQPGCRDGMSATPEDETSWRRWSGRGSSPPGSDTHHTPCQTDKTVWPPGGWGTTGHNVVTDIRGFTSMCNFFPGVQTWVYLVHLSPEAMFEVFLCLSQSLVVLECIQMSQHAHDTRETVYLTDIEKLKRLHLKAKAGINQHQNLETKGSKAFLSFYSFYNFQSEVTNVLLIFNNFFELLFYKLGVQVYVGLSPTHKGLWTWLLTRAPNPP